jgi:hypothetical protein
LVGNARQLGAALALGAIAGGLVVLDIRAVLVVAAALGGLLLGRGLWAFGSRGVAGLAWAGAAFTAPFNGVRVSSLVAVSDVFLVLAVVAMLPPMVVRGREPLRSSSHEGVLVGIALIAVGGTLGTLFATQPVASLAGIAKFVLAAAGSVLAVRLWAPGTREVRWFCSLWLGGAVVSSLWALTLGPELVGRPLGLSTHPNHLGIVCLLATGIALGFILSGRPLARGLSMASFPLLVVVLVASGSRAALLGFFVMVPAVAVLSYRLQLAVRAGVVAAVFGLAVLAGAVDLPASSGLGRLFGDGSTPASDVSRIEGLSTSIDRFERHPLTGEGFEFAQEAHNIYLQVLAAAGPLGLIGLVVVAGSVVRASSAGVRAASGRVSGDHALLAGLAGGYVGYLVAGLFQNILWDRYLWLYIAAILALGASLLAATTEALSSPGGTDSRPPPPDLPPGASREDGPGAIPSIPGSGSSR